MYHSFHFFSTKDEFTLKYKPKSYEYTDRTPTVT
ncbi:MAG: hypothetical protein JWQ57_3014 [Mucilaginibacter sp.]|nr:hypothetical protein [Mucilaginibacter sp.]